MAKENNGIKLYHIFIVVILIVGLVSTLLSFAYYPKSDGRVLEVKVDNLETNIGEIKTGIKDIQKTLFDEFKEVH